MKKYLLALFLLSSSFSVLAEDIDSKIIYNTKTELSCSGMKFSEAQNITLTDLKESQLSINIETFRKQKINGYSKISDYQQFSVSTLNNQRVPIFSSKHIVYPVARDNLGGTPPLNSLLEYDIGMMANFLVHLHKNTDNVNVQLCFSNTEEIDDPLLAFPHLETFSTFRNVNLKLNSPVLLKLNGDRFLKFSISAI